MLKDDTSTRVILKNEFKMTVLPTSLLKLIKDNIPISVKIGNFTNFILTKFLFFLPFLTHTKKKNVISSFTCSKKNKKKKEYNA